MKKKKVLFSLVIFFSLIILFFYYKNLKIVNNISKSNFDFKDYILNISSYEATISVEITSNKNNNKYILKQWFVSPNFFKQEVQAPENIKGLTSIYDGKSLKIENSKLKLSKIYDNYNCVTNNVLNLSNFIEDIKNSEVIEIDEQEKTTIKIESNNRYSKYRELTIDKKTKLPCEVKIMDENKKTLVYILYNEITINNTAKEDII